jgi:hypothetical protein
MEDALGGAIVVFEEDSKGKAIPVTRREDP